MQAPSWEKKSFLNGRRKIEPRTEQAGRIEHGLTCHGRKYIWIFLFRNRTDTIDEQIDLADRLQDEEGQKQLLRRRDENSKQE